MEVIKTHLFLKPEILSPLFLVRQPSHQHHQPIVQPRVSLQQAQPIQQRIIALKMWSIPLNLSAAQLGISYQQPRFSSAPFANSKDAIFLNIIINETLKYHNIRVVSPQFAEVDLYVTADIFGTIRSRTDYLIYNKEELKAKTVLVISAYNRSGGIVGKSQRIGFEADYIEKYFFWMGPVSTTKTLYPVQSFLTEIFSNED